MTSLNPWTPSLQKLSYVLQSQQGQDPTYVANNFDPWKTFLVLQGNGTLVQGTIPLMVYRTLYGALRGPSVSIANFVTRNTDALERSTTTRKRKQTPADVTSNLVGTVAASVICHPISTIATWQIVQFRKTGKIGIVETCERMRAIGKNVYDGVGATVLLNVVVHFLTDPFKSFFKNKFSGLLGRTREPVTDLDFRSLLQGDNQEDVPQEELVERLNDVFLGKAISLSVATLLRLIIYPINTVRYHLEAQGSIGINPIRYKDTVDAVKTIYEEEGVQGFYKGLISVPLSAGFDYAILLGAYVVSSALLRLVETSDARKHVANALKFAPLLV